MKLRSRGLGRKELVMDFREYEIKRDGDEVLISGTITEPVHWDFSITMTPDDIPGLIKVAKSPAMIGMFFRRINPFSKSAADSDAQADAAGKAKTGAGATAAGAGGADASEPEPKADAKAARKAAKAEAKAAKVEAKAAKVEAKAAKAEAQAAKAEAQAAKAEAQAAKAEAPAEARAEPKSEAPASERAGRKGTEPTDVAVEAELEPVLDIEAAETSLGEKPAASSASVA